MSAEWKTLIELLCEAPESQLDASMVTVMRSWEGEPTSLQILEVLDQCAHSAFASDFVMSVLDTMLDLRLKEEGKTMAEIVPLATWRTRA